MLRSPENDCALCNGMIAPSLSPRSTGEDHPRQNHTQEEAV